MERIEEWLEEINEKIDEVLETGLVNATDVRWLKWTVRLLLACVTGLGGVTFGNVV